MILNNKDIKNLGFKILNILWTQETTFANLWGLNTVKFFDLIITQPISRLLMPIAREQRKIFIEKKNFIAKLSYCLCFVTSNFS